MIAVHRLTVENFIGIDRADIDFDSIRRRSGQAGVVLIVGPNGAGKSSLVEAVYFAITGMVARFGQAKRSAIKMGRSMAQVSLVFTAPNGRRYMVKRYIEQKPSGRHRDVLIDLTGGGRIVAQNSNQVDEAVRSLLGFSEFRDPAKDFRGLLRKVFTVFQGEMDEILGTTSDSRPEEILRRLGLLNVDKRAIESEIRRRTQRLKEAMEMVEAERQRLIEEIKHMAEDLAPFTDPKTPPDKPAEVSRNFKKELLEYAIDGADKLIKARDAQVEEELLRGEIGQLKENLARAEERVKSLREGVDATKRKYPFFEDLEFEFFCEDVWGVPQQVVRLASIIVDVAGQLPNARDYRLNYETLQRSLYEMRRISGIKAKSGLDLIRQVLKWVRREVVKRYGAFEDDKLAVVESLANELRDSIQRLSALNSDIRQLEEKIRAIKGRIEKQVDLESRLAEEERRLSGELEQGLELLKNRDVYVKYDRHYRAIKEIPRLERELRKLERLLEQRQSSELLRIFDPLSEDEAWSVLERFANTPVRSRESRKMLPDVMRASASIVAADGRGESDIAGMGLRELRNQIRGIMVQIDRLREDVLPGAPDVPEDDVVEVLLGIEEFERKRDDLERKLRDIQVRLLDVRKQKLALEESLKFFEIQLSEKRQQRDAVLSRYGGLTEMKKMLRYAEFLMIALSHRVSEDAGVSYGDVDLSGVNWDRFVEVAKRYLSARGWFLERIGTAMIGLLGGLPKPEEYGRAVVLAKRYSGILRVLKDRLGEGMDLADVLREYEKFVNDVRALEEAEKTLKELRAELVRKETHLQSVKKRIDEGLKFQDDPLVSVVLGQIAEHENFKDVIARFYGSARDLPIRLSELRQKDEEMARLNREKRVLEVLKVLSARFMDFYIRQQVERFVSHLSRTLRAISGRYTVDNTGDGLVVFDGRFRRPIKSLSGGEKVMLGLAFIFTLADMLAGRGVAREGVFFIDEGFSSLDQSRKERLGEEMQQFNSGGRLIVIITHDDRVKSAFPPDTITLRVDGGRVEEGLLDEVITAPAGEHGLRVWEEEEDF